MLNTKLKNKDIFKAQKSHTREWNYSLLLHNSSNLRKAIVDIYHKNAIDFLLPYCHKKKQFSQSQYKGPPKRYLSIRIFPFI